jgi:uncharacterized protein (DUF2147 family)
MMIRFKPVLCAGFLLILFSLSNSFGQSTPSAADRILGTWLTAEGKARAEVYRTGDRYAGKLVWVRDSLKNGKPALDDKNPDPKLRNRPVINMEFLYGFEFDGDDTWVSGRVYDPESGEEYRGKLRLEDDTTLKLRGYVLVPLLGRTETWTRVK